jgi:hypothetical protein
VLAACKCCVGGARRIQRAIEIAYADRVDLAIMPLDAADRILRQLDRGNLLRLQRRRELNGGRKTPLRFGQRAHSHSFSSMPINDGAV